MSWAFLVDLRLTLPTSAWRRLRSRKPVEFVLKKGWSGLNDESLEAVFGRPATTKETFADVLAWDWGQESICRVNEKVRQTNVRLCAVLDKSVLDQAHPLATLLEAARHERGTGSLRLVNDGTSGAEDGAEMVLAEGKIKRAPIEDFEPVLTELAGELFEVAASKGMARKKNPFTGKAFSPRINPFTGKPLRPPTKTRGR